MEYNLQQINLLDESTVLGDKDFILAEIETVTGSGDRFKTVKMEAGIAFQSKNIRLSNSGNILIEIDDPIFINSDLPSELKTQDDANELFAKCIQTLLDEFNKSTKVFVQPDMPADLPPDANGSPRYYPEGSLWIDTTDFKTYAYYYNINQHGNVKDRYWIGLTDR